MRINHEKANKGRIFETIIIKQNEIYQSRKIANIQKISTPWKVLRNEGKIVSAFPEEKSTLDFRGTVKSGLPVSFDCKESENEKGLPLSYIKPHQAEHIRYALILGELSFVLCYIKPLNKYYVITGLSVITAWDSWQANKGKRGYNLIPIEKMKEIKSSVGNICDYLTIAILYGTKERGY